MKELLVLGLVWPVIGVILHLTRYGEDHPHEGNELGDTCRQSVSFAEVGFAVR